MTIDREIQQEMEQKVASKIEGMIMLNLLKLMVMDKKDKEEHFRKEMEKECLQEAQKIVRDVLDLQEVAANV
jgi:hypothetical protein